MRTLIYPTICAIPVAVLVAQANAQTYTNDSGGSVTFYGQFSPTFQYFDDGERTFSNLADNSNSNSRIGFNIDQELNNGQRLRFNFETAIGFPGTSSFSQEGDDPFWEWEITDLRKAEVIWSGDFGAFSLGQGSMATDGSAGSDLSGTFLTATSLAGDTAGSYLFRESDTGLLSDVAISDAYDDLDGPRLFRIRYDTPGFSGFSAAIAYGTNELTEGDEDTYYDVALNYYDEFGDVVLEGSIGYAWRDRDEGDTDENWVGSLALLHGPTGINGSVAAGGAQDGGSYYYLKAGWIGEFWTVGSSRFAVDYFDGQDYNVDGSESSNWGVHYTQGFDSVSMEGYIGYRVYQYDDDAADYEDASSVLTGVRWTF